MAYVPPALRKRQQAAVGSPPQSDIPICNSNTRDLPSLDDIQTHFWPTVAVTDKQLIDNDDKNPSSFTETDIRATSGVDTSKNVGDNVQPSRKSHSTLNATEVEPNQVRYILLFHNAHPRWHEDNIIYVKTDLHLLPQDTTSASNEGDSKLFHGNEIMVFEQSSDFVSQVAARSRFQFLGFYNLDQMHILEPKSPELVQMLEQKWTRTNKWGKSKQIERDSRSWQKSLSYKWAVLKFKKIVSPELQSNPPNIEVSQSYGRSRGKENVTTMSVNELLHGLRLKDQAKAGSKVDDSVEV